MPVLGLIRRLPAAKIAARGSSPERRVVICAPSVMWIAALVACALAAQEGPKPKTFVSASGRRELVMQHDGASAERAIYVQRLDGVEVARAEHPFLIEKAVVTEDGRAAAYFHAWNASRDGGELVIVVLSPEAQLAGRSSIELVDGGWQHTTHFFHPWPTDLLLQPELGRFVLVAHLGGLWTYELATGAPLAMQRLELDGPGSKGVLGVRAIPETGLLLVAWSKAEYSAADEPTRRDATFELRDEDGATVWSLELAHDYERRGDRGAEQRLWDELRQQPPILEVGARAFAVRSLAGRARMDFAVEPDGKGWRVSESSRTAYADIDGTTRALRPRVLTRVPLAQALPGYPRAMSLVLSPSRGRILVADTEMVRVLDVLGRTIVQWSAETPRAWQERTMSFAHDGAIEFFSGQHRIHRNDDGTLSYIELPARKAVPRPDAAGAWGLQGHTLLRFDAEGTIDLRIYARPDGVALRNIVAFAIAPDGRVALLDLPRSSYFSRSGEQVEPVLCLYDADGHGERTLPLGTFVAPRALSFDGERVLLGSAYAPQLVELGSGARIALELDGPRDLENDTALALAAGGRELWMFRKDTLELVRYALEE